MFSFSSPSASTPAASTTQNTFDIEAQYPASAHTQNQRSSISINPMSASFGYTFGTTATTESRHDGRRLSISADAELEAPPAYAADAPIPLPAYSLHAEEPTTLAMFLFKFGFLFPPFWIFGAFILLSPLREPPSSSVSDSTDSEETLPSAWMPEKTPAERAELLVYLRTVELRWARRSLVALCLFTLLAVAGGVSAWVVLRK